MRFAKFVGSCTLLVIVMSVLTSGGISYARATASTKLPHYDHVFVVVEENHTYASIIGNPAAPIINRLAQQYGLATNYTAVADPSAPNYVALIGGNFYGIADDNAYYTHTVTNPSLVDQLEGAGLTWKGYFQSLPYAGFMGTCFPARCGGVPDSDPLYASKHNPFPYFAHIQNSLKEQRKMVPDTQLDQDLATGHVPNFSFIVPDLCHDMHGAPPYCLDSGNTGDPVDNILVSQGDTYFGNLVKKITSSSTWSRGNNAIVLTWDEGDLPTDPIVTLVITNHGPESIKDNTSYNHYSLLLTIEQVFGLSCLQHSCDQGVKPLAPLFANS